MLVKLVVTIIILISIEALGASTVDVLDTELMSHTLAVHPVAYRIVHYEHRVMLE